MHTFLKEFFIRLTKTQILDTTLQYCSALPTQATMSKIISKGTGSIIILKKDSMFSCGTTEVITGALEAQHLTI
jgi:hypothetical protein